MNTLNRSIGLVGREFDNSPDDWGSIPGRVIPKTQNMVLDAALFNTQYYKVRNKGKLKQSWEIPQQFFSVVAFEKGDFRSPSNTVANNTLYIYIYIYIYIIHIYIYILYHHVYIYIYIWLKFIYYIYVYIYIYKYIFIYIYIYTYISVNLNHMYK